MCVCVCVCVFSSVQLFATTWAVAHQALQSMAFPRQEYRSVLPFPAPGDLPNPGTGPMSHGLLHWQMESLPLAPPSATESKRPEDCPTSVLPVNQVYTFLKENEKNIYMTQILT